MLLKKKIIKILIITTILIFGFLFSNQDLDLWLIRRSFEPVRYNNYIEKYAEEYSLDSDLLAALIYVESRFNPDSVSHRGAVGLMQLMPTTAFWIAEELGKDNFDLEMLKDAEINIKLGSWYFSYLYQKFDYDLIKTLAAYNAGESNVRYWLASGWEGDLEKSLPFRETDNFVRRVLSTKDYYKSSKISFIAFGKADFLVNIFE